MRIHRIKTGAKEPDKYAEAFLKYGVIAIGWSKVGDISKMDKKEIEEKISQYYPKRKSGKSVLLRFRDKIQVGDYVIAYKPRNTIAGIGKIVGNYYYDDTDELGSELGFPHKRKVEWLPQPRGFPRNALPEGLGSFRGTLCSKDYGKDYGIDNLIEYINKALKGGNDAINNTNEGKPIVKTGNKLQSILTALNTKPFLILAGVSGTGKTQIARIVAGVMAKEES